MRFTKIHIVLLLSLLVISCDDKEKQLENRERELQLREQKVLAIEADYQELLKLRDSLAKEKALASDTIAAVKTWPLNLQRVWSSKMIGTESNCSNYVIGDQRNEEWSFLSDSTGLYMNVANNNKLVRVFKGSTSDGKIMLEYNADSTSVRKQKISIVLDDIQDNLIKGTQTITGQKDCTAKFSVELTPSAKK